MARVILITSGKGGTGKTFLTANLAYALAELNQRVYAIDANLTTPNLALHFGLLAPNITLHDFLRGNFEIERCIYKLPSGINLIPGSISLGKLSGLEPSMLINAVLPILPKADFILLDGSAGIGRETLACLEACDEIILVTNPNLPAILDGLKVLKLAEKLDKKILGVVINRIPKKFKFMDFVEAFFDYPILARIPEDRKVEESIFLRRPLFELFPESKAAVEIKKLGYWLLGKEFKVKKQSFFKLMLKIFGR